MSNYSKHLFLLEFSVSLYQKTRNKDSFFFFFSWNGNCRFLYGLLNIPLFYLLVNGFSNQVLTVKWQILLYMQIKYDTPWLYQSSSRLTRWKHKTVQTRIKKDVNSISMAGVSIRCACLRIAGMAMLPTADAPVKNFAASIQPPPSLLVKNWVEPPPKNKQGIGTSTYMRADNIGHQLLYRAQACHNN